MNGPNLDGLATLVALADAGSLSAAGGRLGVSQQVASARMHALEQRLRLELTAGSTRGAALTADGALVAQWSADLLAAVARFEAATGALTADAPRVAASPTVAEHLLPGWLALAGDAAVRVVPLKSAAAIAAVRVGEVALAFVETPALPDDLQTLVVARDEPVVLVRPGAAWASRAIRFAEVVATPLVLREAGAGIRVAFERAVGTVLAAPVAELPTSSAVRAAVLAGVAPGVLSPLAVADDLAVGRLVAVAVTGLDADRPITAIWRQDPPSAVARLRDVAAASGAALPRRP